MGPRFDSWTLKDFLDLTLRCESTVKQSLSLFSSLFLLYMAESSPIYINALGMVISQTFPKGFRNVSETIPKRFRNIPRTFGKLRTLTR